MEEQSFKGHRILIADDNLMELEILKEMAESLGVEVETATNGQEALDTLLASEVGHFDLFISDIFMPQLKGYETAMKFRLSQRDDARTLPIIGISADTASNLYEITISSGMSSMMLKPVTLPIINAFFTLFLNDRKANMIFSAQMQNRIEEDRKMREFIQNISTNIRTPLLSIMEFASLLKSGEISGDEAKNFADVITSASERINKILNSSQLDLN